MPLRRHADAIRELYLRYHRRRWVHPDPLEFLYAYDDPADREIVGFVTACLSYGRVEQILRSVSVVLGRMGDSPRRFVLDSRPGRLVETFGDFRHRFSNGEHLASLLAAIGRAVRKYGGLREAFQLGLETRDRTVLPGLNRFAALLAGEAPRPCGHLLADPGKGSCCKRYHLFLRWMVRRDAIDPGGWEGVGPERLIVPLDTHMHRIASALGATRRKTPDLRAALEITEAFRRIEPSDPVRYDFALTRLGIHPQADLDDFLAGCGVG